MSEIKMDAAREVAIMEDAIDTYGILAQEQVAIEEMAELTQAIVKVWRSPILSDEFRAAKAQVREEMADVSIMLSQLELIFGDVSEIEAEKLERLEQRLEAMRG